MVTAAAGVFVVAGTSGAAAERPGHTGSALVGSVDATWLDASDDAAGAASLTGRTGGAGSEGVSRSDWRQQTEQRAALAQQVQEQAAQAAALAQQQAAAQAQAEAAAQAQAAHDAAVAAAVADPKGTAAAMAASRGWTGGQFRCLDSLWTRESSWNYQAENASSGAYGIPQALPAQKLATAGGDWRDNPATQITWGLDYIARTYGSPCGAWSHSQGYGWY